MLYKAYLNGKSYEVNKLSLAVLSFVNTGLSKVEKYSFSLVVNTLVESV